MSSQEYSKATFEDQLARCKRIEYRIETCEKNMDFYDTLRGSKDPPVGARWRMAVISGRLAKFETLMAAFSYVQDKPEWGETFAKRKTLVGLQSHLRDQLEDLKSVEALCTEIIDRETLFRRALINELKSTPPKLAQPFRERRKELDQTIDQADDVFERSDREIDELLLAIDTRDASYSFLGGDGFIDAPKMPCPQEEATRFYPPPNPAVAEVAQAVLKALDSAAAGSALPQAGHGGRAIGVAQLEGDIFVVSVSGDQKDVPPFIDAIGKHLPASLMDKVRFAPVVVENLKLNPPLSDDAISPSKKCAMPKLYKAAETRGVKVVAPTEIWWGGAKLPPKENPCPAAPGSQFMYPCEWCAWNAKGIQTGEAWK